MSASLSSALTVAGPMVTATLLALRWARVLRVKLEVVVAVPVPVVGVLPLVVVVLGWPAADAGGLRAE